MPAKILHCNVVQPDMISNGAQDSGALKPTYSNHRRLLASIDNAADSITDVDSTTDDEAWGQVAGQHGHDPNSLLSFSISHTQTRMRSAQTPAFEKAQALEASNGYFTTEPDTIEGEHQDGDDRYASNTHVLEGLAGHRTSQVISSATGRNDSAPSHRLSISRVFLGDSTHKGRRRSSSGPGAILGGLRKLLPGSSTLGQSSTSNNEKDISTSKVEISPCASTASSQALTEAETAKQSKFEQDLRSPTLDGNVSSSSIQEDKRPKALRRVTSDNSLYLRRAITGASDFDDITAFAKVADMPNSRMKAITDSFQDTSIRLPKLSNINISSSHGSPSRMNSDLTKRNTLANASQTNNINPIPLSASPMQTTPQIPIPKETKHPVLKEALTRATGDIVFMGGYRGSILRSAEPPHHQVWVPVKVGLNLRKVDLEVGLTHEDEERMEEKIVPSGILSHIGPIDISRRLLKKVRKSPAARSNQLRVHDWGYDWRLSPHRLSHRLIQFLETLECNHPETPPERRGALVVAHSLGGLITRHAVNQRPELFSGVVFAGTPQNCCNILGPLRNGDDVLVSSRVLTAQVNFTLRTSYALLPENGRCFLNKDTGERYDVDFFDINSWEEYRLSPCINPVLSTNIKAPTKRKPRIGSLSESISALTPSLPTKKISWLPNKESSPPRDMRERARDMKDDIGDAARKAGDYMHSAADSTGQSLEPSMKPGNKPSVATAVTIPKDKAWEYLDRTLAEVKLFKEQLNHKPEYQTQNRYPPQAIIFSKCLPTVYGAKVASREAIKQSDAYDDLAFAAGDGVVLASAAQLPLGYRCVRGGRVESERGHVGLLGDLEAVGQCIGAVIEGRQRGIGVSTSQENSLK